ncbi:hypothetical protein VTN49DRAFT_4718 [Thermomyces lanuginosus]|uniref:uncharacterized protein n=1 Tax=Thermomyces lanuginosus TaxID=5541 RepID=UPI0037428456
MQRTHDFRGNSRNPAEDGKMGCRERWLELIHTAQHCRHAATGSRLRTSRYFHALYELAGGQGNTPQLCAPSTEGTSVLNVSSNLIVPQILSIV